MNNSFLSILSRHQLMLTFAIVMVFLTSGAFFYSNKLNQQTAVVVDAKCSSQSEIVEQKVELEMLSKQASDLEAEITKAEQNIIAGSASQTTDKIRLEKLKTEILSDYAVSLENENVNRLCPEEGIEPPECVSAQRSYNNLVKDNEAKKKELNYLEKKIANGDNDPSFDISKKKAESEAINTQIADLTEAITVAEANICPEEIK